MVFVKKSKYHADSECGLFTISRANGAGGSGSYMAVRNTDKKILSVHRFTCEADRGDAYTAAVAACEDASRE